MAESETIDSAMTAARRVDAVRNAQTVLDAAAAVFVESGVDVPVRRIAERAGVGIATVYRHYPTRIDLIVAVYRHQVEACAGAAPEILLTEDPPFRALSRWVHLFAEFLTTKHGLARALSSDAAGFRALHEYFIDRLVPACDLLLNAAIDAGEIPSPVNALVLLRAVGNLSITSATDEDGETRWMIDVFLDGLTVRPGDAHQHAAESAELPEDV